MRHRARFLAAAAAFGLLVAGPARASDEKAFAELKAAYEKAAKKHDDNGIRQRRKLLLDAFDFLDQKSCRKFLRDAFENEDAVDTRVAAIQVLAATGDPKDLDLIVKSLAREKLRGPAIAVGEGLACTAPEAAAAISVHAVGIAAKARGDLRLSLFEGVGELGDPAAYAPLLALGEKWMPDEHFARAVALGACGKGQAVAGLTADANVAAPVIRLGAVLGLARTGAPESMAPLVAALHSPYPLVVEAAADALGAAKHQPAAVPLADALATAPLRVKFAIRAALTAIVGKDHGLSAEAWRNALAGKKSEPAAPPADEPKLPAFFGIPVASDRVVALLDVSRSMVWNDRLKRAQDGIAQFLQSLDDGVSFNVYSMARTTERFGASSTAGAASRGQAVAWVRKQLTSGGSDLSAALRAILLDNPDADTILVATDSLPWGTSAAETAMEAMEVFRRENLTRRVRLHIAMVVPGGRFTTSEDLEDFEDRALLLKLMAETSGGKFVRVEQ